MSKDVQLSLVLTHDATETYEGVEEMLHTY